MGLLEPTSGQIQIDGKTIDASNRGVNGSNTSAMYQQHIYLSDAIDCCEHRSGRALRAL